MAALRRLLAPGRPSPIAWTLLLIAAIAVGIAAYLHGHLFWQGYAHVAVVGPLCWLIAEIVAAALVLVALAIARTSIVAPSEAERSA